MFGYDFAAPYLTSHQVDKKGALIRSEAIDLPGPSMMHEFAITEHYVVFLDLPIVFDLAQAMTGSKFPFHWSDDYGARSIVMPRTGGNEDVKRIEIDPCFIFHTMNTHEATDGKIVLEAARHPELWRDGPNDFASKPHLWRWTIEPDKGTASDLVPDVS